MEKGKAKEQPVPITPGGLHVKVKRHLPDLPIKDTSLWVAILIHDTLTMNEIKDGRSFVFIKANPKITVKTIRYKYFERYPIDDVTLQWKNCIANETWNVGQLRSHFDNVVVFRAMSREGITDEELLADIREQEEQQKKQLWKGYTQDDAIEIDDDSESDGEDEDVVADADVDEDAMADAEIDTGAHNGFMPHDAGEPSYIDEPSPLFKPEYQGEPIVIDSDEELGDGFGAWDGYYQNEVTPPPGPSAAFGNALRVKEGALSYSNYDVVDYNGWQHVAPDAPAGGLRYGQIETPAVNGSMYGPVDPAYQQWHSSATVSGPVCGSFNAPVPRAFSTYPTAPPTGDRYDPYDNDAGPAEDDVRFRESSVLSFRTVRSSQSEDAAGEPDNDYELPPVPYSGSHHAQSHQNEQEAVLFDRAPRTPDAESEATARDEADATYSTTPVKRFQEIEAAAPQQTGFPGWSSLTSASYGIASAVRGLFDYGAAQPSLPGPTMTQRTPTTEEEEYFGSSNNYHVSSSETPAELAGSKRKASKIVVLKTPQAKRAKHDVEAAAPLTPVSPKSSRPSRQATHADHMRIHAEQDYQVQAEEGHEADDEGDAGWTGALDEEQDQYGD